jgi:alkaline phosphatase D
MGYFCFFPNKKNMKNLFYLVLIIGIFGCEVAKMPTPPTVPTKKLANNTLTTIAFGSCNKQNKPQPIWDVVLQDEPDLWIWLGDNIYGDTDDMNLLKSKYDQQLAQTKYQQLMKTCPIIGVWDDHDYGLNDGGKEWSKKDESKELMLDFLKVDKNAAVRKRKGAYQSYTFGEKGQLVKIILLDTRYFRDKLEKNTVGKNRYKINEKGDMLGEEQWTWLETELSDESVDLYLIGGGIQVIPMDHGFEKWANFPKSRKRILSLLEKSNPKSVILLSGDRHISEISKMKLEGVNYPIYDITASGMTHSYEAIKDEPNRYRVDNKITGQKNFGLMKIDWNSEPLSVKVEIKGLENKILLEEKISF